MANPNVQALLNEFRRAQQAHVDEVRSKSTGPDGQKITSAGTVRPGERKPEPTPPPKGATP
jgi:hypothetical protein